MRSGRQYRSNPPLMGRHWNGEKCFDDYTAGPTYRNFTTTDDYGNLVDTRRPDAGDINDDEEQLASSGLQPYFLPNGSGTTFS